ncbi:hypothetical protein KJ671_02775 [Patescibacteria group bacterium]|nr:hypothetical protein [Patescibacteria group bacterium]
MKKNKFEKGLLQLHSMLQSSFKNVKNDTTVIFQWLEYIQKLNQQQQSLIQEQQRTLADIQHKNNDQEEAIRDLNLQLKYMPRSPEELKKILEAYYSYEPVLTRIKELNDKVEELKVSQQPIKNKVEYLHTRIERIPSKLSIKEKIIKRITKHSKDYIKNFLLSLIRKYEKVSALQLREIVVEEQGLCSKSSFYRILEEVENDDSIGVIRQNKEKLYQYKQITIHRR